MTQNVGIIRRIMLGGATGLVACGFFIVGCGSGGKTPSELRSLAVVKGQVTFNGQPTDGAVLKFFKDDIDTSDLGLVTIAKVEADGRFLAQTIVPGGTGIGVAPGDYSVSFSWSKPVNVNDRDSDLGPELLPEKYLHHATSGIKVNVKPGQNELPTIALNP